MVQTYGSNHTFRERKMVDSMKKVIPEPLSANFQGSFAYFTVRDRLPIILTKVVDGLAREKDAIVEKYGQDTREQLKEVIGRLSKLKNEIQTDKSVEPLKDSGLDVAIWNQRIEEETSNSGSPPSWFTSAWLLVECYMYRRIYEAFQLSPILKVHDSFADQKEEAFLGSLGAIKILAKHLMSVTESGRSNSTKAEFRQFLQLDLWGNKCDLSLSAGKENSQKLNPVTQLDALQKFILVDDTRCIWDKLQQCNDEHPGDVRVDFILDNAGFELFTDLCFADFLCSKNLVRSVRFHVKEMPWFVSDATSRDIAWTLRTMKGYIEEQTLSDLGNRWERLFDSGRWEVISHFFWTLPHDFSEMSTVAPALYEQLAESHLLIFKGDLNYRKLTGDRKWEPTTLFDVSLRGFKPAAMCTLRTLKADIVVGLRPDQAEESREIEATWMTSGNFAVIQFLSV